MARAVLKKFECSDEVGGVLLATGQDRLLYASRFDAYYGIGFTMKEAPGRVEEWGRNYLGEMLMIVRKRLWERGGVPLVSAGMADVSNELICLQIGDE
jgi:ribA/ribD-fused uncharacterized protein